MSEPTHKADKFIWAVIFILSGIVLLLNNFRYLSWEFWTVIVSFWPLLFVFWGVSLFFGRSRVGVVVGNAINLILILGAVGYSLAQTNAAFCEQLESYTNILRCEKTELQQLNYSSTIEGMQFSGAETADIELVADYNRINISDTAEPYFASVSSYYASKFSKPELSAKLTDDALKITFKDELRHALGSMRINNSWKKDTDFVIGSAAKKYTISSVIGSGSVNATLGNNYYSRVSLDVGAGRARIDFTKIFNETTLDLSVGAGKVELILPSDVSLEIRTEVGLGKAYINGEKLPATFRRESTGPKVIIDASVGTGIFDLKLN